MTATTELFWNYFEPAVTNIDGVRNVKLSDGDRMERFVTASVSEDLYPAVFSFRPKYRIVDNGAQQYYCVFETVFYVFCLSSIGDEDSQDAAFDQAEEMALAILNKFRMDHFEGDQVDFEYGSARLEPVTMMTMDSAQGYEVKLKLGIQANAIFS